LKSKILLKEKATHGTALIPIAIRHLNYAEGLENFFYLHWHSEFEFVYILSGAILYSIEDKEYCVKAGEGLFIHSNQLHAARSFNGMPCEACVVLFHPNLFGHNKQSSTYSKFIYPILEGDLVFENYFKCEEEWQRLVMKLLSELDDLKYENVSENELLLKSKIFEIWHLCYKNSVALAPQGRKNRNYKLERMQPVLNYIHENYKEEITLMALAKILPMSEGQFCHAFKEVMNISPIAYVIRHRILQSCTLLTETDWKIADIARNVGFNNISYFNREFIKAIGCSPSKYRLEG